MEIVWLKFPIGIYYILTILGCYTLFKSINFIVLNIKSFLKFKRPYRTVNEEKMFFLLEEKKKHLKKIEVLENEIDELTKQIINKL